MPLRNSLVDPVFGRGDAVDGFLAGRVLRQLRAPQQPQFGRHRELHGRVQLRQYDLADRIVGAQQKDRVERLDRLLVALLPRHGPDLATVAATVDHQHAVSGETDLRLAQGRGIGNCRSEQQ